MRPPLTHASGLNHDMSADLEPLHRFHTFCARFPSEIAEAAIRELTRPGDPIYDPFCGSGTSLVAGLAQGRRVVGGDVDVLAGLLSEVKCTPRARDEYADWRAAFERELEERFSQVTDSWPPSPQRPSHGTRWNVAGVPLEVPDFPQLNYWFPPQLTAFLATIADAARASPDRHLGLVALTSLSASIIAKWPNTLSYAMDVDHTRPHRRVQQFRRDGVLKAYLSRLDRTIACLSGLYAAYETAGVLGELDGRWTILCPHDARSPSEHVDEASQQLVVTSPPYLDAVDYPRAHRLSVCWMNGYAPAMLASRQGYMGLTQNAGLDGEAWLAEHREVRRLIPEPILETKRGRRIIGFFADLEATLIEMHRVLRPGGHAVIVIGDNTVRGHTLKSHLAVLRLARRLGLLDRETKPREIESIRRRFPVGPFGFEGPMSNEHVIVLRKPA
jgi:hypothetical protein